MTWGLGTTIVVGEMTMRLKGMDQERLKITYGSRMKEVIFKQIHFVMKVIATSFTQEMIPIVSITWSKGYLLYIQEKQLLSLTPWKTVTTM